MPDPIEFPTPDTGAPPPEVPVPEAAIALVRRFGGDEAALGPALRTVTDLVTVPLNDNQLAALVSVVSTVEPQSFADSIGLEKLNQGDYAYAAQLTGFGIEAVAELEVEERRRAAEQQLFLTPPQVKINVELVPAMAAAEYLTGQEYPELRPGAEGTMAVLILPHVPMWLPEAVEQ